MGVSWVILFSGTLLLLLSYSGGEVVSVHVDQVATVDVHRAKDLVSSGHRYIDVRTEEEFNKGHVDVENTLNIPYMFNTPQGRVKNPEFLAKVLLACSKDDYLVMGCQSGVRSLHASVELLNTGFKHVKNMGGGYLAWMENNLAVKKPQVKSHGRGLCCMNLGKEHLKPKTESDGTGLCCMAGGERFKPTITL